MHKPPVLMSSAAATSHLSMLGKREAEALSSASRLYALRRRINEASAANTARPVRVVLYALVHPGDDPHDHLAAAQGLAKARGRVVSERFCDTAEDSSPATRPGWARARRAIVDGPAHGIIAISRTAISNSDQLYETELGWFGRHGAALWLVRPETAL